MRGLSTRRAAGTAPGRPTGHAPGWGLHRHGVLTRFARTQARESLLGWAGRDCGDLAGACVGGAGHRRPTTAHRPPASRARRGSAASQRAPLGGAVEGKRRGAAVTPAPRPCRPAVAALPGGGADPHRSAQRGVAGTTRVGWRSARRLAGSRGSGGTTGACRPPQPAHAASSQRRARAPGPDRGGHGVDRRGHQPARRHPSARSCRGTGARRHRHRADRRLGSPALTGASRPGGSGAGLHVDGGALRPAGPLGHLPRATDRALRRLDAAARTRVRGRAARRRAGLSPRAAGAGGHLDLETGRRWSRSHSPRIHDPKRPSSDATTFPTRAAASKQNATT